MKSSNHTQRIREEIALLQLKAEEANGYANSLTNLVLNYHSSLISDTTIVRETATLLQHVVQNFNRTATATLGSKASKDKQAV